MSAETDRMKLLEDFMDAWNQHDVDKLMTMMSEHCRFYGSSGTSKDGVAYIGRESARQGYEAIFAIFSDAQWCDATHRVIGGKGLSEWTFKGTKPGGEKVVTRGCDVFSFDGNKIAVKDSFRKTILSDP